MKNIDLEELGNLVEIKTGRLDANAADIDGIYPFYTCADIPLRINKALGDYECVLLIGNGANTGKVFHNKGPFNAYQRTYILKPLKIENCRYLFWFLNYKTNYFLTRSIGSATNYIKLGDITKLKIPQYSASEQKKIVNIFDNVFNLIKKHKQLLNNYDSLIKSRFIEMFGDPVQNPMKWEKKNLSEWCTKVTDGTHDTPPRYTSGVLLLTGKNIRADHIDFSEIEYVSPEDHKIIYERCNPEYGDVLYTNIGVNYGTAVLNTLDYQFSMKNIALLKPKRDLVSGYYLWFVLNLLRNKILDENKTGGAQTFMSLATIRNLIIPMPPISLQNDFASFVQQIDKSKFAVQKSLEKTETLYKSLMQEYFG